MRIRLRRLRAVGPNVPSAEIHFGNGLTVLSGASNTGKSYVLQCIQYMLGGQEPPKPVQGDDHYDTLLLEMSAGDTLVSSPFTLRRALKMGGEIALHRCAIDSESFDEEFTVIGWKHNPKNKQNVSRFLLDLCDIDGTLLQSKSSATRPISFGDLRRFIIVSETTIIDDTSPVYPSRQRQDKPLEKAIFDFLISGQDAKGVVVRPDIKVATAHWLAQTSLLDELIAEATNQLESMALPEQVQLEKVEWRAAELISVINKRTVDISELSSTRQSEWRKLRSRQARLDAVQQLLIRFDLLRQHYESDVNRLTFIAEGEFLLSQLSEVKCPLCQTIMSVPVDGLVPVANRSKSIQLSCVAERQKIERSIADLQVTTSGLIAERESLTSEISGIQDRLKEVERAIGQELQPAIAASHEELNQLNVVRQRSALAETLRTRIQSLQEMRSALGPKPRRTRSATASPGTSMQQKGRRAFCDEVQRLLTAWQYPNVGVTEFSEQMDLVVNGETRFGQGKGHRAVLYSAFTIALMNVSNGRHPQFVVIDSPLTSYKPNDTYRVEEDIVRGFYESLVKTPQTQQIIIIENDDPPADLIPKMTHIHFSGPEGNGRMGFYSLT